MSAKGKKKGGAKKTAAEGGENNEANVNKMTPELYELKIKDLETKTDHWKKRFNELQGDLEQQEKQVEAIAKDKNDVIEFLRLQLIQNEAKLATFTKKCFDLENERDHIRDTLSREKREEVDQALNEMQEVSRQCKKYKNELDALLDFKNRKSELEKHVLELSDMLEEKDKEFKEAVHSLERKTIQDKSLLRKEMLNKVNEVVTSFRNLSDQQMAETTKRTIQENMAVNSQLQKLSAKIVELLQENKTLIESRNQIKQQIELSLSNEKELAKKTQSYKRIIKLLMGKNDELEEELRQIKNPQGRVSILVENFEDSFKGEMALTSDDDLGNSEMGEEEDIERQSNSNNWTRKQSEVAKSTSMNNVKDIEQNSSAAPVINFSTSENEQKASKVIKKESSSTLTKEDMNSLASVIVDLLQGSRKAKEFAKDSRWVSEMNEFVKEKSENEKPKNGRRSDTLIKLLLKEWKSMKMPREGSPDRNNKTKKHISESKFVPKDFLDREAIVEELEKLEQHPAASEAEKIKQEIANTRIETGFKPPYKKGELSVDEILTPIRNRKAKNVAVQTQTKRLDPSLVLGEVRPWGKPVANE